MRYRSRLLVGLIMGFSLMATLAWGQGYTRPPTPVLPASGLTVLYSDGTVTSGGRQLTINAGSLILTNNMTNCAAPQFIACNIVYWDGHSASLSVTTDPPTAFAVGQTVVGFMTTSGGNVVSFVGAAASYEGLPGAPTINFGLPLATCNPVRRINCVPCTRGTLGCFQ